MCRFVVSFMMSFLIAASSLLQASGVSAQDRVPFGMAVIDVTATSSCSITNRTYASSDFESEVVDEEVLSCPAGTVVLSTPVDSERQAAGMGGIFVPLTGNYEADVNAVANAKSRLSPTVTRSYGNEQSEALACSDRGFSKSLSYYANSPGVTVYSTVYLWQDYTCATGLSSATARLSWNADLYWRFSEYFAPGQYYYNSHGCTNLSTSNTYDQYNVTRPFGYLYRDESINFSPCAGGWGDSYTGSVYL